MRERGIVKNSSWTRPEGLAATGVIPGFGLAICLLILGSANDANTAAPGAPHEQSPAACSQLNYGTPAPRPIGDEEQGTIIAPR